ncbi:short-chain dehydrogenase/reductase SDR [Sistotremastrum niveocremeum HHB9708]|uniref:Short-chain dehydrogenase/reductase SDR n=2 Tax=Sistotremastraceae TaxID=3402574 RepID=A0A164NDZ9_9AGAM|nr:short-chain dehydrogenase/reductase SDR [Sistotremastrum niveocremeum HHB9708]KZT34506.1 short-chain dehydrogenase/reductase SDR [Sistotremastrum suecicum HHB10207 ss-3]
MALSSLRKLGGVAMISGAGSGMGRACAINFARAGCKLVLTDVNEKGIDATISATGLDSANVLKAVFDLRQDGALEELVASIPKRFGRLDYAINAAGICGRFNPLVDEPIEHIDDVLDINLRAQIVANRAQVQAMLLPKEQLSARVYEAPDMGENEKSRRINKAKNFKGSIVNFSSVTGLKSFDGIVGSYTVSKHGMIGLTRAMATQYGPAGIRTNAVCPGFISTPLLWNDLPGVEEHVSTVPAGRFGDVEDVADVVSFLCSEEAAYVNGTTLTVDGALTT